MTKLDERSYWMLRDDFTAFLSIAGRIARREMTTEQVAAIVAPIAGAALTNHYNLDMTKALVLLAALFARSEDAAEVLVGYERLAGALREDFDRRFPPPSSTKELAR